MSRGVGRLVGPGSSSWLFCCLLKILVENKGQ